MEILSLTLAMIGCLLAAIGEALAPVKVTTIEDLLERYK
jgi:hypothetical protein